MPCFSKFGCQVGCSEHLSIFQADALLFCIWVRLIAVSICLVFKQTPCFSLSGCQVGSIEHLSSIKWLYLVVIVSIYALFISSRYLVYLVDVKPDVLIMTLHVLAQDNNGSGLRFPPRFFSSLRLYSIHSIMQCIQIFVMYLHIPSKMYTI